jgi:hypothetical protein
VQAIAVLIGGLAPWGASQASDPCDGVTGVALRTVKASPPAIESVDACGFPAASRDAGLIAIADTGRVDSCMSKVCLYNATVTAGPPIAEWGLRPETWAETGARADSSSLWELLSQQRFVPMVRIQPSRQSHGTLERGFYVLDFEFDELRIVFESTAEDATLTVHSAGQIVEKHEFQPRILHCVDEEVGEVRSLRRVPGSVELRGLPGLSAVVVEATYFGYEYGCSYFDSLVVAWSGAG